MKHRLLPEAISLIALGLYLSWGAIIWLLQAFARGTSPQSVANQINEIHD